jgi:methionine salvage enolase-phosphatase E1
MSAMQKMVEILHRMITNQQTNKQTNMKTLNDIVEPLVKEMVNNGELFSAHDVTTEARKSINESKDAFVLPVIYHSQGVQVYEVNHNEVRQIVNKMYQQGELDRVFNGTYFIYSGKQSEATQCTPITQPTTLTGQDKFLADRIYGYLHRNGQRTVQYILGTVCRYDADNRSVDKLVSIMEKDYRFKCVNPSEVDTYRVYQLVL